MTNEKSKKIKAKKEKVKKATRLIVKSLSDLNEHDEILFQLKDFDAEIKAGKINSKSLIAQPLEASVITIENRHISVRTKNSSFFDLTLADYIIIKKLKNYSKSQAKKEDVNAQEQNQDKSEVSIK